MKKQILKIAGVKSEKEFYKKYPTEEAFMKAHGKAFKKAQIGTYMTSQAEMPVYAPADIRGMQDELEYQLTGMTASDRQKIETLGEIASEYNIDPAQLQDFSEEILNSAPPAKRGKKIKKAQGGTSTQSEPNIGDPCCPDYNSWQAAHNLWQQGQRYDDQGGGSGIAAPTTGGAAGNIPSATTNTAAKSAGSDSKPKTDNTAAYVQSGIDVIQGISMIKQQQNAVKEAKQTAALTDAMGLAAASVPAQPIRRQYVRPEDVVIQPEQLYPSYGVGTNVLAEFGASVGGGEIMNTYAPNTLYDNLGYEPLNDSERYKQFYRGGKLKKAKIGNQLWMQDTKFGNYMMNQGGIGTLGSLDTWVQGEPEAGNKIGKGIGTAAGTALGGPIGGAIGGFLGSTIGGIIDRSEEKIKEYQAESKRNMGDIMGRNFGMGIQSQFASYMEDGGTTSPYAWVSHTWQPQKIVSFGGHNLKDLLKPPHDADMLRAGGHLKAYTPPSERAMSTERPLMQMGGELQTHWGGYAEPMSYNPYLPDGGETIMFRGQSHDESDGRGNTGIGITYGENPVEVERGEPAIKLKDGTGTDSSLVVFGNLKIPKAYVPILGKEAQGKKFKTYVADLSKKENRQNKMMDKATKMLEDFEVSSPIDKMTLNSLQYTMLGANQKLKEIADKKMTAASLQNAINDTAEEMGLVADDLARGKVKIDKNAFKSEAKLGKKIPKAQNGLTTELGETLTENDLNYLNGLYEKAKTSKRGADVVKFQQEFHRLLPKSALKYNKETKFLTGKAKSLGVTKSDLDKIDVNNPSGDLEKKVLAGNEDEFFGPITTKYIEIANAIPRTPTPKFTPVPVTQVPTGTTGNVTTNFPIVPYKRNTLVDVLGQIVPYLRPSDAEALDPRQLLGETYAIATNQLEPVQAQTIQPQLDVPYDISLQDIINENEATYRSQQRMVGYNPAIQGQLSAQKYAANAKVLGEQFRLNQAKRAEVYDRNRNLLNQYGLQNLGILDRQYERQAQALSKTKATTQAALNSITEKFLRNRLENRTLATMENLYNYRFDPRFRAINMNAPFQPQIPTVYVGPDGKQYQSVPVLDAQGNVVGYQQQPAATGVPSTATPGIVPAGKVPAAAPSASPVPQVISPSTVEPAPGTIGPPDLFTPINTQSTPSDFEQDVLTEDELKGYGKKGIKVTKKKGLNSSIVRAFKNL